MALSDDEHEFNQKLVQERMSRVEEQDEARRRKSREYSARKRRRLTQ